MTEQLNWTEQIPEKQQDLKEKSLMTFKFWFIAEDNFFFSQDCYFGSEPRELQFLE